MLLNKNKTDDFKAPAMNCLMREDSFGDSLSQFENDEIFKSLLENSGNEFHTENLKDMSASLGELGVLNDFLSNYSRKSVSWGNKFDSEENMKQGRFGQEDITDRLYDILKKKNILSQILSIDPNINRSHLVFQVINQPIIQLSFDDVENNLLKKAEIEKYRATL